MTAFRFPIASALALVLTAGLFWFLSALIRVNLETMNRRPATKIEFTRLRRDTEVKTIRRQKPELEKTSQSPNVPQISTAVNLGGGTSGFAISAPVLEGMASLGGISGGLAINVVGSDRDVIPLVRIEPDYPPRATERGIEGWVVVQFTITPAGTVKDAKVVDADPKGIFETAAVKAVERWKYNPKVENGVAVERRGVQVMLTFKLEK